MNVEVCLKPSSAVDADALRGSVLELLSVAGHLIEGQALDVGASAVLAANVDRVKVFDVASWPWRHAGDAPRARAPDV